MATMSVSGVVSGMDWDSMIDELITNAAKPAQVQVSKRTNLTNKKSLFEEMKVTMNSLQSSLTNLKLPSTYKAKELSIERIDTNGSYKGVLTATVNADAEVNVYDLKVNKLARAQTNRSKQITASTVSSALSDQGLTSGTMYINMAGQKVGIEISSTDSLQSIKSKINNTVKTLDIPVEVTASVVDNRLIIRSDNTGLGSNSLTETLTYSLNGKNTITSFNVNDSDLGTDTFVIRNSKGNKLTYGKDYDVVNGNEIRWNQYEPTDEVKLGKSVTATYTMAVGDVITKSGYKMGTDTVNVKNSLGFTPKYNENLTITTYTTASDGTTTDNNAYTYGKDFTLDDNGNIEWLTTTNYTPSGTYTATYEFDGTESYSANGTQASGGIAQSIVTTKFGLTFSDLEQQLSLDSTNTYVSGSNNYKYISNEVGASAFKVMNTDTGVAYTYGTDYRIRSGGNGVASIEFAESLRNVNVNFSIDYTPPAGTTITASGTSSDTNALTLFNFPSTFTPDVDHITITDDTTGETMTSGTEYTIASDGTITWQTVTETTTTPPEDGADFRLTYTASAAIESSYNTLVNTATSYTYKGNTFIADKVSYLYLEADDGAMTPTATETSNGVTGNYLSMQQIYNDIKDREGITAPYSRGNNSDEFHAALSKYFSVTSGTTEYTYGTDYIVTYGGSYNAAGTDRQAIIRWLPGGNKPSTTDFTVTYTGRGTSYADDPETIDLSMTRSNTDAIQSGASGTSPLYSYFDGGTSTITQGSKTYYEGIDYEIGKITTTDANGNTITNASVEWKTGTSSEWYYPNPGENSRYTINLTTKNGRSLSFTAVRDSVDTLDLRDYGFTSVNGSITALSYQGSSTHTYDLTKAAETTTDNDGNVTEVPSGKDQAKSTLGLDITNSTNGGFNTFNFNWVTPTRTANADLPGLNEEFKVEYTYNANTFTLSDDSDGKLLAALELDLTDSDHYMAAQNAELELDGETITRDSNDIGEAYDNELIKGMTIHLKGVGEVSLDVAHDAQKAVESIQTFVDTYNDLMTWMNTRMTESEVDKDTAATIDSDDFRMRWGLLHGNSLLRQTKSRMRSIATQNFTFSFTQRTSAEEIYGNMSYNGLKAEATLRLRISNKFVDVSILPTDTLQDIVDKINDDTKGGAMNDIYYDDDGNKLPQALLKAEIKDDRLVINSTGNDSITMSGTSAMNALKMNYTYKGLYQIGISTTSTDYGKSGELEFDTSTFMEALEDNADEVQELMLMFANEFDTWTKSMLNSSASGETSGTLTRQIEDLENQISTIDEYLEKYQDRLDRMEENLQKKYANVETSLSKLTQQANSISAILNQLNGYTSSNSSSSS